MPPGLPYWKSVAIAHDQLINAWLGGFCDESLSSRAYRMSVKGIRHWPRKLIDTLLWFDREGDKRHCELSFESECQMRHLPVEARGGLKDAGE